MASKLGLFGVYLILVFFEDLCSVKLGCVDLCAVKFICDDSRGCRILIDALNHFGSIFVARNSYIRSEVLLVDDVCKLPTGLKRVAK